MFANLLAAPFVFGALVVLYLSWKVDTEYAPWMIPFVLLTALVYVFSPQINWWWYNRRPPELPGGLRGLLERFHPFYKNLNALDRRRFRGRVALFKMGNEWMPMGWPEEEVPADVQLMLAAQAVALTFHKPWFLFEKFETVIVYPQPFPTPEYPFEHASEMYESDGCLLFSAEQVIRAFTEPDKWYNVGLHEYAKAYLLADPESTLPLLESTEAVWEKLQEISGMPRVHVESVVGLAGLEPLPVAIHHYFVFNARLRQVWPELAGQMDAVFKKNVLIVK